MDFVSTYQTKGNLDVWYGREESNQVLWCRSATNCRSNQSSSWTQYRKFVLRHTYLWSGRRWRGTVGKRPRMVVTMAWASNHKSNILSTPYHIFRGNVQKPGWDSKVSYSQTRASGGNWNEIAERPSISPYPLCLLRKSAVLRLLYKFSCLNPLHYFIECRASRAWRSPMSLRVDLDDVWVGPVPDVHDVRDHQVVQVRYDIPYCDPSFLIIFLPNFEVAVMVWTMCCTQV